MASGGSAPGGGSGGTALTRRKRVAGTMTNGPPITLHRLQLHWTAGSTGGASISKATRLQWQAPAWVMRWEGNGAGGPGGERARKAGVVVVVVVRVGAPAIY